MFVSHRGITYHQNNVLYYCEIKPTENIDTKYAIRIAIGQLLEYKFFNDYMAIPVIVLSSRPRKKEIEFVKSFGFHLTYYDKKANGFITL